MAEMDEMRVAGRKKDQQRVLKFKFGFCEYADGSVLIELGKTKVLCNVTIQHGVPRFMKDKKSGWLTAEYSMIPPATQVRTTREASVQKRNARSSEISRLIGRVFRTIVDLDKTCQKTIYIDCDVLQADGSTRVAAITGSWMALKIAEKTWKKDKVFCNDILLEDVVALSTGMKGEVGLLDLDFAEDSSIDGDFNFVLTRSGKILEIQGTAEKNAIDWEDFDKMKSLAINGAKSLFAECDLSLEQYNKKS